MLTLVERRLRDDKRAVIDVLMATRAVFANLGLPGKFGPAGIELTFAIASRRADREAGWARVSHTEVARDAGIRRDQLRLLIRAMAGDSLIERRAGRPVATAQGYRSAVYLRSLVGGEVIDLLRALACWTPDWPQYERCRPPRPPGGSGGRAPPAAGRRGRRPRARAASCR